MRFGPGGGVPVAAGGPDWRGASLPRVVAGPGTPVSDLLTLHGRDRQRRVGQLLAGGLSPARAATVVFGSLWGGTGTSTLAGMVAAVWAGHGVRPVLLDAAGQEDPGLVQRVPAQLVSGSPTWRQLIGTQEQHRADFAAVAASTGGWVVVTGPTGPTSEQVAVVAGAAQAGYGLVVVDAGRGWRVADLAATVRADLLVMVCRPSEYELRRTGEWLRGSEALAELVAAHRVVVAVVGVPAMRTTAVAAAMPAVSDVSAGAVRIDGRRELTVRTTPVTGRYADEGTELVAASVAAARS